MISLISDLELQHYVVSEGARSPLEFFGRSFNASGQSAANILSSDESNFSRCFILSW